MGVTPLPPECYHMFKVKLLYAHNSLAAESGNLGLSFIAFSEKEEAMIIKKKIKKK